MSSRPGSGKGYSGSWCDGAIIAATPIALPATSSNARFGQPLTRARSESPCFAHRRETIDAAALSGSAAEEFTLAETPAARHRPRRTAPTSSSSPSVRRPPKAPWRPASAGAGLSRAGLAPAAATSGRAVELPQTSSERGILGLQPAEPELLSRSTAARPSSAPLVRAAKDRDPLDEAIAKTVQATRSQPKTRGLRAARSSPNIGSPAAGRAPALAALTGRKLEHSELGKLERGEHVAPPPARRNVETVVVVLDRDPAGGYGLDLRVGELSAKSDDGVTLAGKRLLVARVRPGTPAATADLWPEDEIVGAAVVSAGGCEMRPLELGPTFADSGLQTIRQACTQAQRMWWTVHRPSDADHRASAWRDTLQSPDLNSPPHS